MRFLVLPLFVSLTLPLVVVTNGFLDSDTFDMDGETLSKPLGLADYKKYLDAGLRTLCQFSEPGKDADPHCKSCVASIRMLIDSAIEGREWAILMLDATLKPPAGIFAGQFAFVSHYDQCMQIKPVRVADMTQHYEDIIEDEVQGTYCGMSISLRKNPKHVDNPNVTKSEIEEVFKKEEKGLDDVKKMMDNFPGFVGLCLPSACNKMGLDKIGKAIENPVRLYFRKKEHQSKVPVLLKTEVISCNTNKDLYKVKWTLSGRIIGGIFAALALLVAVGTLVDLVFSLKTQRDDDSLDGRKRHLHEYHFGGLAEALRSCSVYTSVRRLVDTRVPKETIKCLNGVKVLSIIWIIIANTGTLRGFNMTSNMKEMQKALEQLPTQFVLNSQLAIDSLFVVWGILFAYGLSKKNGITHILRFVAHRIIRIIPMYLLLLWFLACIFHGLGAGPTWDMEHGRFLEKCNKSWFYNLLFINNFVSVKNQCMPHAWVIAYMFQMLIVSIVATFCWKKAQDLTHLALGILVLITMIINFVLNFRAEIGPTSLLREYRKGSRDLYMETVGMKIYTRGGPFLIGLIIGFIFNQKASNKQLSRTFSKLSRYAATCLWLLILIVLVATVNAPFTWNKGTATPSVFGAAMYDSFHRVIWALAIGLLIMACYANKGGFINCLLSWSAFTPLSRLTLIIYLINPFVIFHTNGTTKGVVYYSMHLLGSEILFNTVISIVVSVIIHILLVSPFAAIEQYLMVKFMGGDSLDSMEEGLNDRYHHDFKEKMDIPDSKASTATSTSQKKKNSKDDLHPEPYEKHRQPSPKLKATGDDKATGAASKDVNVSSSEKEPLIVELHSLDKSTYLPSPRVDNDYDTPPRRN